ncbi:MAG: hypothetical protein AB7I18_08715 [Candidatus Berkiella sp.]
MNFAEQQMLEIIKVYEHHMTQFDRLMHLVETLKQENKRLRALVQSQATGEQSAKPRIVCRPLI